MTNIDHDFKYYEKDPSSNNIEAQSQIISFGNVVSYAFAEIKAEETSHIALLIGRCLVRLIQLNKNHSDFLIKKYLNFYLIGRINKLFNNY